MPITDGSRLNRESSENTFLADQISKAKNSCRDDIESVWLRCHFSLVFICVRFEELILKVVISATCDHLSAFICALFAHFCARHSLCHLFYHFDSVSFVIFSISVIFHIVSLNYIYHLQCFGILSFFLFSLFVGFVFWKSGKKVQQFWGKLDNVGKFLNLFQI